MAGEWQGGSIKAGSTSVSLPVTLRKTADGTEQTGTASGSVTAAYWRQGGTPTSFAVSALAAIDSAYSSGGWKEADATKHPGDYRLDFPDAAFAAGAAWVRVAAVVADCFVWSATIPLTTNVVQTGDSYAEVTHASYGLSKLVRSTTPANTLAVTAGNKVDVNDKTGFRLDAQGSIALTESYAADGAEPTLAQLLYQLWATLSQFAISGTTISCKKLDGSTECMTFSLNSASAPTSRTRAT